MKLRTWMVWVFLLFGLTAAIPAHAQLTLTLSPATLTGAQNTSLTFNGTITNTSGADVFVNDIVITLLGNAPLTPNTNIFFNNVPGIFAAGEVYSNSAIFGIDIPFDTANGTYSGTIQFLGGSDPNAADTLLAQEATFGVVVAPEAGSVILLGMGIVLVGVRGLGRRRGSAG